MWRDYADLNFRGSHEVEAPFLRLVALDQSLREPGATWRWQQEVAQGLGQPMLNFYAPGVSFGTLAFFRAGWNLRWSILGYLGVVLAVGMSGSYLLGAYVWSRSPAAREPSGPGLAPLAGLLTAGLNMWGNYTWNNIFIRGALAETSALMCVPWALLGLAGIALTPRSGARGAWSLLFAVAFGGILWTHNITALLFAYALSLWGLVLLARMAWAKLGGMAGQFSDLADQVRWNLLGGLLGLCLGAAFWLPALMMKGEVYLDLIHRFHLFRIEQNFRSLREILLPAPSWINIGWVPALAFTALMFWILAGVARRAPRMLSGADAMAAGRATARRSPGAWDTFLVWVIAVFVGALWLVNPYAEFVYRILPLLEVIQFPWRFMGWGTIFGALVTAIGCCSALATLASAMPIETGRALGRRVLPWAAALAIVACSQGLSRPHMWSLFDDLRTSSPERILERMRSNYLTATGVDEYRPRVAPVPRWRRDFLVAAPPWRLMGGKVAWLRDGWDWVEELPVERRNHQFSWTLPKYARENGCELCVGVYAMRGWRVEADGKQLPPQYLKPDDQDGLLNIKVPPGVSHMTLQRELLPVQRSGNMLSLLALLALIAGTAAVATRALRQPGRTPAPLCP